MMNEKRETKRAAVHSVVEIHDLANGEKLGHLANISEGGFLLIADHQIPVNKLFQLNLSFTSKEGEPVTMEVGAESLWVQEMTDSGSYWYGFHIFDIAEQNIRIIDELVSRWSN